MQWSSRAMLRLLIVNILDREEKIMDEQITTLASLTIDGKGSYGIGASAVPFSKDLYTYLRITDIKDDGTLNLQDLKSVDDEKASEYLLKPNDIVFARTGASTGRNYFYDGTDGEFVYAGFLIKFSIDEKKVNPKYIKYFCQSKQYKDWINSFNTGSTRGNINAQTLGKMPIPLIERKTQDALVCILSSIDEKIKKNNEINNNLLEQLNQLYTEFSTRSDWSEMTIGDVAVKVAMGPFGSNIKVSTFVEYGVPIISGNHLRGYFLEEPSYNYITEEHAEKLKNSIVYPKDIIFTHAGNIGQVAMIPDGCEFPYYVLSQRQFYLRCNTELVVPEYVLLFFHSKKGQHELLSYANQTGVPSIAQPATNLKKIRLPIPSLDEQKDWLSVVAPLITMYQNNYQETKRLASLRDTLLPKLMSGGIDVSNLNL